MERKVLEQIVARLCDGQPVAFIGSMDGEGYPEMKAMLAPRVREGARVFYFTTNTSSMRVRHFRANPKACVYFCDGPGFQGLMLKGEMETLTDAASRESIWRPGDEVYYPGGVTDPDYCVLRFTARSGRYYNEFSSGQFEI